MIKELNVQDHIVAANILAIQQPAYMVEAKLINFYDIPPLKDTVDSIKLCDETFYGYFIDDVLAGFVSFKKGKGELDIHRLVVNPAHFKKGIASELIRFIIEHNRDVKKAIVSTGAKNLPAVQLYKRLGFTEKDTKEILPGLMITHFEYWYKPYILRSCKPGDMGWITYRHGVLYSEEYGWDGRFEGLVARIVSDFIHSHNPEKERCWIAEMNGEIVGSVFLVAQNDTDAKLRLLYVEPKARGLGLGKHLVSECIVYAKAKGYKKVSLWTNSVLTAARKIYEKAGFALISEEHHHSFGHDLVSETWEIKL